MAMENERERENPAPYKPQWDKGLLVLQRLAKEEL